MHNDENGTLIVYCDTTDGIKIEEEDLSYPSISITDTTTEKGMFLLLDNGCSLYFISQIRS